MLIYPKYNVHEFIVRPPYNPLQKKQMYDYFVNKHNHMLTNEKWYKNTDYNFPIDCFSEYCAQLQSIFLNACTDIFGKVTRGVDNDYTCWANVTDRVSKNIAHDHSRRCNINSVFYFSVPDVKTGYIYFLKDNRLLIKHLPKENSLLIFPAHLTHLPSNCNSDNYRVAINMEMRSQESYWIED